MPSAREKIEKISKFIERASLQNLWAGIQHADAVPPTRLDALATAGMGMKLGRFLVAIKDDPAKLLRFCQSLADSGWQGEAKTLSPDVRVQLVRCVLILEGEMAEANRPDKHATPDPVAVAIPMNGEKPRSDGKKLIEPCDDAFKAYRAHRIAGKSQTDVATMLGKTQGQVSRWVKQVAEWIEAGNVLPDLPGMTTKPSSIDPSVIDMGERQDGRTKRQRAKSRDDE